METPNVPTFILGIDVGAIFQQEFRDFNVVVSRCQMERGGISALGIAAVDVVCCY